MKEREGEFGNECSARNSHGPDGERAEKCPRKEATGADDAGPGANELAGGAANARVSGEQGTRKTADSRLGGRVKAAGVLLAGETGEGGIAAKPGDGRSKSRAGAQHVQNYREGPRGAGRRARTRGMDNAARPARFSDRKSTRLNSSHSQISYAV